jgi:hypothetical protein
MRIPSSGRRLDADDGVTYLTGEIHDHAAIWSNKRIRHYATASETRVLTRDYANSRPVFASM